MLLRALGWPTGRAIMLHQAEGAITAALAMSMRDGEGDRQGSAQYGSSVGRAKEAPKLGRCASHFGAFCTLVAFPTVTGTSVWRRVMVELFLRNKSVLVPESLTHHTEE